MTNARLRNPEILRAVLHLPAMSFDMSKSFCRSFFMAIVLISVHSWTFADSGQDTGLAVTVRKNAGVIFVDVSMRVPATPQEAWDVLTDYDHMAQFFPNLQTSKVTAKAGNVIRVAQKGRISYGLLAFPFESVREIELMPYSELRSHAISGSLRRADAITRLIPEGAGTRITYHSESVPNVWVPPGIGPGFIEKETRAQFENLRNEILKRKGVGRR
ncbi:MAG: hypothetical protein JWQ21_1981 [Herminiimonas sp.]|nr:hypothetical protein [Herminiimonas sp.]